MKNTELQKLIKKVMSTEGAKAVIALIDGLELENSQIKEQVKDYEKLAVRTRKTINHSRENLKKAQAEATKLRKRLAS